MAYFTQINRLDQIQIKKGVEYDYSKLLLDDTDLWIATVLNSPEPYNYGIGHE